MKDWNEWIMDVTDWPKYCFCPYEPETGNVVLGMNVIQDRSPGKLAGIYHGDGGDFAETWCRDNPSWRELYSPNDKLTPLPGAATVERKEKEIT